MNLVKKAAGYLGQIGETFDKVNSFIDLVSKLFHSSGDKWQIKNPNPSLTQFKLTIRETYNVTILIEDKITKKKKREKDEFVNQWPLLMVQLSEVEGRESSL